MPGLNRIRGVTIGAPDVSAIETVYTRALGYAVVEQSSVSKRLAESWGTPATAGAKQVLMHPATGEDVFIRAVETPAIASYQPMNSWGWNSFEIIVNDVDDLHQRLLETEFRHIGGPANLSGAYASIRASQYVGPAGEVLYFNCETGDREASSLPDPGSDVGRPNIVILAGANIDDAIQFYRQVAGINEGVLFETTIGVVAKAQNLPETSLFPMGFNRLTQPGNAIEFDGYPSGTGPRPRTAGHLPVGNAMVSFGVESLSDFDIESFGPAHLEYGSNKAIAFEGPCTEIVELIEETQR